ncbi:hypothetical protein C8J57DRAFT_1294158 [Mycena rebaudengoi]|nr:hypothetical protein C8J57DRAFT_1294158 [Mycena rebaudengoi]
MADEDIDNETLQAQIDLSLSFTQNLVASWVKPTRKPAKSSSSALEAELKEYMRRPPRLGVGAPIPEGTISSRETERLKSHLSGKGHKRARGEEATGIKEPSDEEDEGRGASLKKKARIDPFEARSKKQKKEPDNIRVSTPEPSSPTLSPSKRPRRKNTRTRIHPVLEGNEPGPSKPSPLQINDNIATTPATATKGISPPAPRHLPLGGQCKACFSRDPVLNLDGPPADDDESDDEEAPADTPSTSPKKKRRKRKKKKSLLGAEHM